MRQRSFRSTTNTRWVVRAWCDPCGYLVMSTKQEYPWSWTLPHPRGWQTVRTIVGGEHHLNSVMQYIANRTYAIRIVRNQVTVAMHRWYIWCRELSKSESFEITDDTKQQQQLNAATLTNACDGPEHDDTVGCWTHRRIAPHASWVDVDRPL